MASVVEKRAVERWTAHGLECAITAGPYCFNGYAKLPAGHPGLTAEYPWEIADAPGGITYGPDEDGWVGFDTGHAGDAWAPDDLIGVLDDHGFKAAMTMQGINRIPWETLWTRDLLRIEVEDFAERLAQQVSRP